MPTSCSQSASGWTEGSAAPKIKIKIKIEIEIKIKIEITIKIEMKRDLGAAFGPDGQSFFLEAFGLASLEDFDSDLVFLPESVDLLSLEGLSALAAFL